MYKKTLITIVILLTIIAQATFGENETSTFSFNKKQQVGLRLGAWINNGEEHPSLINSSDGQSQIRTSISDANFYIEGYYALNIFPSLFAEISFGMVNRGTVEVYSGNTYDLGNILLYPILIQGKVYPLIKTSSRFQPFFGGGGGIYYGRHSIQLTTDFYAQYYNLQGDSETKFNYTLVGGFDWGLGDKISLEMHARYLPIEFKDDLILVKDYKATTITIGIKYRFNKSK